MDYSRIEGQSYLGSSINNELSTETSIQTQIIDNSSVIFVPPVLETNNGSFLLTGISSVLKYRPYTLNLYFKLSENSTENALVAWNLNNQGPYYNALINYIPFWIPTDSIKAGVDDTLYIGVFNSVSNPPLNVQYGVAFTNTSVPTTGYCGYNYTLPITGTTNIYVNINVSSNQLVLC